MYCSNCGNETSKYDNYCMHCGIKLKQFNQQEKKYGDHLPFERKENSKSRDNLLEYFRKFLFKPHHIMNSNKSITPVVPIIILFSWILINTLLTIGAIKSTIKTTITKIIESIPLPEITSGSEYVDDIVSGILGEKDFLPEWANTDYLINGLFDYINPYYISLMIMIFIILVITYNVTFLYFVPLREKDLSKVITDYITLYFVSLISTSIGLIVINVGLLYVGIFIIIFAVIYGLLMPLYLLFNYTGNGRYRLDLVYSIVVYISGVVIIYFMILHGLILRTINNFMEQIDIITEFLTRF